MKLTSLPIFILSPLFLLVGCSEEPNSVGRNVLPPQDELTIDSLATTATSASSYRYAIPGLSNRLLLGRTADLEARTLLQFTGILSGLSGITIDSASLKLNINYRFKSLDGTLSFTVQQFLRPWNEGTFTWDSLTSGTVNDTIDTTFVKAITSEDSILVVRLDNLVGKWYRNGLTSPDGIILKPAISANTIIGFASYSDGSTSLDPELFISYHDSVKRDSLRLRPIQRSFVANTALPTTSPYSFVQAGVAYRGRLMFDVSALPRSASITQASMEIVVDTSMSFFGSSLHDSLGLHLILDGSTPPKLSGTLTFGRSKDTSKTIYRFDMRNVVQQWVTGRTNYGIVLRSSDETASLDRFAVYGNSAAADLRPKLKIIYTVLP